jgi:GT2 family glycosyltransferase
MARQPPGGAKRPRYNLGPLMDPLAPPVVAAVVTWDPGPWFEEALAAFADQDYPNLSVLVLDAGSRFDITPRVASVLPGAYVRRLGTNLGFSATANQVLHVVEGASHLVLCHDDVAPERRAISVMVEEAFRSNAGVVAPKLVDWDDASRLLQVGMGADKAGVARPRVEPGELDQEQHDAVRDVFFAPGGLVLVRADLFATLGGFDADMCLFGEDLDLCWRAQVAGARVVVAPTARVRHRQALRRGERRLVLPSPAGQAPEPTDEEFARRADWSAGELEELREASLAAGQEAVPVAPPAGGGEGTAGEGLGPEEGPGDEAAGASPAGADAFVLERRHQIRAVLKNYSPWHLVRVLPQVLALSLAEVAYGLATGRPARAAGVLRAWRWNLGGLRGVRAERARLRRLRALPDSEVRRLQARGSAQLVSFSLRQLGRAHLSPARYLEGDRRLRPALAFWAGAALVVAWGDRGLVAGPLPVVGQLAPFPGVGDALHLLFSGWSPAGVGSAAPATPAMGLIGLAGSVLLGGVGLLEKLVFLGALPVGALGTWRAARSLGPWPRLAATGVYLAVPVAYNAMAQGRLQALLAYAAAPWVVHRLLRAGGAPPLPRSPSPLAVQALGLGLVLALVWAFVPAAPLLVAVPAGALALAGLANREWEATARLAACAAGALVVAGAFCFPWDLGLAHPGAPAAGLGGQPPALGWGQVLRLQDGPLGGPPVGWAFAAAAALPLVVGRSWRLSLACRSWALSLAAWACAWAGSRGWLGASFGPAGAWLAMAGVGVALAAGLGVAAFQADLRIHRFGWRQGLSMLVGGAAVLGAFPVVASAAGGRWNLPPAGYEQALSWLPGPGRGSYRVLWVGSPRALPDSGWPLGPGAAYATSQDGLPSAADLYPPADPGPGRRLAQALEEARSWRTLRLGHLLAPLGVRYLVVPSQLAPAGPDQPTLAPMPPPPGLVDSLLAQADLRLMPSPAGLVTFENTAWMPVRAAVGPDALGAVASASPEAALGAELSGSRPVLPGPALATSFSGRLSPGVVVNSTGSGRWRLEVSGRLAPRRTAFGWADAYRVSRAGPATLGFSTPASHLAAVWAEVAAWVLAAWALARSRLGARRRA